MKNDAIRQILRTPSTPPLAVRGLANSEIGGVATGSNAQLLATWPNIAALGSVAVLRSPFLGLFCSIRCPGRLILDLYDLARELRDAGVPIVGGFHTPMEKECLDLLLRGHQPVVLCPARSIERMRLPVPLTAAVSAGRLLLLSPFRGSARRPTVELAAERNRFVAALASEVFIAYAHPGGNTEQLCRDLIATGKTVLTFAATANAPLVAIGATPLKGAALVERWTNAVRQSP